MCFCSPFYLPEISPHKDHLLVLPASASPVNFHGDRISHLRKVHNILLLLPPADQWKCPEDAFKSNQLLKDERGEVDSGGILKVGLGLSCSKEIFPTTSHSVIKDPKKWYQDVFLTFSETWNSKYRQLNSEVAIFSSLLILDWLHVNLLIPAIGFPLSMIIALVSIFFSFPTDIIANSP